MAELDLNDVLVDPDLCDTFDVIRRTDVVSVATGRSTITEATTEGVVGVVTPGDSGNLLRKDDNQKTSRLITVSTPFRLRASGDGFQPDVIFYDGVRFTVKACKLWNRLGRGWIRVVAESENAFDPAPV